MPAKVLNVSRLGGELPGIGWKEDSKDFRLSIIAFIGRIEPPAKATISFLPSSRARLKLPETEVFGGKLLFLF